MVELPPLILCVRCFSVFKATSLFCCVHHFQSCTAQTLMGPLWGFVLWFSQWGSCTQTKYPLVHSPHPKIYQSTSLVSPPMPKLFVYGKPVMIWVECFNTILPQKLCTGMKQCAGTGTGQLTCWGYREGCHFAMLLNSSTSMGVCS